VVVEKVAAATGSGGHAQHRVGGHAAQAVVHQLEKFS
jgi:hypothetical protein